MKKVLCSLLTMLIMTTSIQVMASEMKFSDLPSSHWAYNSVSEMVRKGVIEGYPDGTFRPESNVTRGEFCVMLSKAANLYVDLNVTGDHWATPYAETIKRATWTYEDWYLKSGDLDAPINRAETAMGIRDVYLGYPQSLTHMMTEVYSYLESLYADCSNIGGFSECVYTLSKNNIMNGYEDGCFHPEYPITRAEMCTVLLRAFNDRNTASKSNNNIDNISINTNSKNYDYSISYNILKTWMILHGETAIGSAYWITSSHDDMVVEITYLKDLSIGFSIKSTLESGARYEMSLLVFGNYSSPGVISTLTTPDGKKNEVVGIYNSSKITITSSDFPQNNDVAIETINKAYSLFDMLMETKGIGLKISDFGISY